jgi:hypothetical protein
MTTPGSLRWVLAALMVGVTLFHVLRLLSARFIRSHGRIGVELTHAAMGAVMTAMLVGTLARATTQLLIFVFLASTAWFAVLGIHSYIWSGRSALEVPVQQAVNCAAMTYMLAVVAVPTGHEMGSMAPTPLRSRSGSSPSRFARSVGCGSDLSRRCPRFRSAVRWQ